MRPLLVFLVLVTLIVFASNSYAQMGDPAVVKMPLQKTWQSISRTPDAYCQRFYGNAAHDSYAGNWKYTYEPNGEGTGVVPRFGCMTGGRQFLGGHSVDYDSGHDCPNGTLTDENGVKRCSKAVAVCGMVITISQEVGRTESGSFPAKICKENTDNPGTFCVYKSEIPMYTEGNDIVALFNSGKLSETGAVSCIPTDYDMALPPALNFPFDPDTARGRLTKDDTRVVESSEEVSPQNSVCVSNGDGTDTCTIIKTKNQKTTSGKGNVLATDGTGGTYSHHTGDVTEKRTTDTTITDGKGTTKHIVRVESTTVGGSTVTETFHSDGTVTTHTTPHSEPNTFTRTTTTTTHPDGRVTTDTTSGSDGDGDGVGQSNRSKALCGAPGQPSCQIHNPSGCGGTGQPVCKFGFESPKGLISGGGTIQGAGITEQLDDFITIIEESTSMDLDDQILIVNPLKLYSGGSCNPGAFSASYHGATLSPLSSFCTYYDSDIRPMLAYFFYGIGSFAIYGIFVRTLRGTS